MADRGYDLTAETQAALDALAETRRDLDTAIESHARAEARARCLLRQLEEHAELSARELGASELRRLFARNRRPSEQGNSYA